MEERPWIGVGSPEFRAIAERIKAATRLSSEFSGYCWDEPEQGRAVFEELIGKPVGDPFHLIPPSSADDGLDVTIDRSGRATGVHHRGTHHRRAERVERHRPIDPEDGRVTVRRRTPDRPVPPGDAPSAPWVGGPANVRGVGTRRPPTVDEIPVAHTPPGGFGDTFPEPVLAGCREPIVEGAPDLRGLWRAVRAVRAGVPVPADDPILTYVERIEQCGDRIVDMGGGTVADARADGTEDHGVHDVSAFDFSTPIHVVATYENGAFVLRPVGVPGLEVTRRLDADGRMVWTRPDLGGLVVTLERAGDGSGTPANTFRRGGPGG